MSLPLVACRTDHRPVEICWQIGSGTPCLRNPSAPDWLRRTVGNIFDTSEKESSNDVLLQPRSRRAATSGEARCRRAPQIQTLPWAHSWRAKARGPSQGVQGRAHSASASKAHTGARSVWGRHRRCTAFLVVCPDRVAPGVLPWRPRRHSAGVCLQHPSLPTGRVPVWPTSPGVAVRRGRKWRFAGPAWPSPRLTRAVQVLAAHPAAAAATTLLGMVPRRAPPPPTRPSWTWPPSGG